MPYQTLHSEKIVQTVELLCQRIEERFPASGLGRLSQKLLEVSREAQQRSEWIAKPIIFLRILAVLLIALLVIGVGLAVISFARPVGGEGFFAFIQALESGTNELILCGAAIFFLVSLETRLKRRRALTAIHELRAIAHIIDMHQLTKDPEWVLDRGSQTPSSPQRHKQMTSFELSRYLDYCSEMLSLCSKIATLYVQRFDDPVALVAVNEVEGLAGELSSKIWQKLVILHTVRI